MKKLMLEIDIQPYPQDQSEFFDSWDEIDEDGTKHHFVCLQGFEQIPSISFCFYKHEQNLCAIISPGQGCRWRSVPDYCDRFDPEQNYDECLKCEKLLGSLGEKQWTTFFNEQKALIAISKDRCTKPTKCAESEK